MSRRFVHTFRTTILPSTLLMVLVLIWLGLSFHDTSLFYYYFQMNVFDPPDTSINIFAGIACIIPPLTCAYLLSNFIVKRLTSSIHSIIRIENILSISRQICVPMFMYIACYTVLEFVIVLSIDLFHQVLPVFDHDVFILICLIAFTTLSRFIGLCTLVTLCNSITLFTSIEVSSVALLIIYGFGLLITPFLRNIPIYRFLPWTIFAQRSGFADLVGVSFNGLLLITFLALINWHIRHHDFLEAS